MAHLSLQPNQDKFRSGDLLEHEKHQDKFRSGEEHEVSHEVSFLSVKETSHTTSIKDQQSSSRLQVQASSENINCADPSASEVFSDNYRSGASTTTCCETSFLSTAESDSRDHSFLLGGGSAASSQHSSGDNSSTTSSLHIENSCSFSGDQHLQQGSQSGSQSSSLIIVHDKSEDIIDSVEDQARRHSTFLDISMEDNIMEGNNLNLNTGGDTNTRVGGDNTLVGKDNPKTPNPSSTNNMEGPEVAGGSGSLTTDAKQVVGGEDVRVSIGGGSSEQVGAEISPSSEKKDAPADDHVDPSNNYGFESPTTEGQHVENKNFEKKSDVGAEEQFLVPSPMPEKSVPQHDQEDETSTMKKETAGTSTADSQNPPSSMNNANDKVKQLLGSLIGENINGSAANVHAEKNTEQADDRTSSTQDKSTASLIEDLKGLLFQNTNLITTKGGENNSSADRHQIEQQLVMHLQNLTQQSGSYNQNQMNQSQGGSSDKQHLQGHQSEEHQSNFNYPEDDYINGHYSTQNSLSSLPKNGTLAQRSGHMSGGSLSGSSSAKMSGRQSVGGAQAQKHNEQNQYSSRDQDHLPDEYDYDTMSNPHEDQQENSSNSPATSTMREGFRRHHAGGTTSSQDSQGRKKNGGPNNSSLGPGTSTNNHISPDFHCENRSRNFCPIDPNDSPTRLTVQFRNISNRCSAIAVANMLFANDVVQNDAKLLTLLDANLELERANRKVFGLEETVDSYTKRKESFLNEVKVLTRLPDLHALSKKNTVPTTAYFDPMNPSYVPKMCPGFWTHLVPNVPVPLQLLKVSLHPFVRKMIRFFNLSHSKVQDFGWILILK